MEKLLVDTNIILDLLSKREEFYQEAQQLFTLADTKQVELYVSSLLFANTYYLLSKFQNREEARKTLIKFKLLVHVAPLDDRIVELALLSDFKDFEDEIQYHTALENGINIIISQNKKDFKTSKLPVMTAKEYLMK